MDLPTTIAIYLLALVALAAVPIFFAGQAPDIISSRLMLKVVAERPVEVLPLGIIEEIKGCIERLSDAEHAELRAWFIEHDHVLGDEQIGIDQATGKLKGLRAESKAQEP